jgi:hypothetical protein
VVDRKILTASVNFLGCDIPNKRSCVLRKALILILLAALLMVFGGCTISHEFGPYSGKVVDAQTGEPIEGAVVLIGFYTKSFSVGGPVYRFADAFEVLSDAKGEFRFPPKRVTLFRAMSIWDKECSISIFKPGYGAYPRHKKTFSTPKLIQSRIIPEDEHIIFNLPKLLTLEERKENRYLIQTPAGITIGKMPNMRRLQSEERVNIGLPPY